MSRSTLAGVAVPLLLLFLPSLALGQTIVEVQVFVPDEGGGVTAGGSGGGFPSAGDRVGIGRLPAPVPPGVNAPGRGPNGAGSARAPLPGSGSAPLPGAGSAPPRTDLPPETSSTLIYLKKHSVDVRLVDGIAVTTIDQTWHNAGRMQMEGTYVCPLPKDAVLQSFSIFMGAREVHGEVMETAAGRAIYDRITRRSRDPGIVELLRKKQPMIQTRIFPIPPRGDMRVKMSYAHALERVGGRYRTRLPQKNLTRGNRPALESFRLRLQADLSQPEQRVFARGYEFDRIESGHGDSWVGTFEESDFRPSRDLEVCCLAGRGEPGLTLRVHRAGNGERFFMATVSAGDLDIRDPVLEFDGIEASEVYPKELRAVGKGRLGVLFGKIIGEGEIEARLAGTASGEPLVIPATIDEKDNEFVESLFALHRVRRILARGRVGPEAQKEIVALGTRYGILTPYTVFLAR